MQSMNAKDAVSASLAECFITIEGNRYNFMQAINLEASKSPFWGGPGKEIRRPDGRGAVPRPSTTIPVSSGSCCTGTRRPDRMCILISR